MTGCAAISLGLAAPANADLAPGDYHHRSIMANGIVTDNLMQVTSCGPGCISSFNLTSNADQGPAHIQGNQYVLDQFVPGGAFCPVGSTWSPDPPSTSTVRTGSTRSTAPIPAVPAARWARRGSRSHPVERHEELRGLTFTILRRPRDGSSQRVVALRAGKSDRRVRHRVLRVGDASIQPPFARLEIIGASRRGTAARLREPAAA
jgi:hypothetical protein